MLIRDYRLEIKPEHVLKLDTETDISYVNPICAAFNAQYHPKFSRIINGVLVAEFETVVKLFALSDDALSFWNNWVAGNMTKNVHVITIHIWRAFLDIPQQKRVDDNGN